MKDKGEKKNKFRQFHMKVILLPFSNIRIIKCLSEPSKTLFILSSPFSNIHFFPPHSFSQFEYSAG